LSSIPDVPEADLETEGVAGFVVDRIGRVRKFVKAKGEKQKLERGVALRVVRKRSIERAGGKKKNRFRHAGLRSKEQALNSGLWKVSPILYSIVERGDIIFHRLLRGRRIRWKERCSPANALQKHY